ncbi:MAG TPA: phosphatase PAP2 family protein [Pirellulales bacterium]|nr:phosphatase PAP2 family protein [Pirellulales bacterium]
MLHQSRTSGITFHLRLLAVLFVVAAASPSFAQDHYLPAGKPDVLTLLPPPPAADSPEQAADLAETVAAHKTITAEEKAKAEAEEKKFSVASFASTIGPAFQLNKLPKTAAFFEHVQKETEEVIDVGKNHWQRPRPYQVDPTDLHHGEKNPSFGYPSGHSTQATVLAALLAEAIPDKRDAILAEGRQVGWDRVMLGRHYETDIYAGRVLGQAIVRQLHESPAFEHDFAEVKAEVAKNLAIAATTTSAMPPHAAMTMPSGSPTVPLTPAQ